MNEEKFRAELYRHLMNRLEEYKDQGIDLEIEDRGPMQKYGKATIGRADLVIYKNEEPILIIETKPKDSQLAAAVTQVYRYGFLFGMSDEYFVAVCSPATLKIYKYDMELGNAANETPIEADGGFYIENGVVVFSWEKESEKRLVRGHTFDNLDSISKIASTIIDFLKDQDILTEKSIKLKIS